jgi:hypothetical protein
MSDPGSVTALWSFVWDCAKSNPATLLALISAITALTVAVVTPVVSFLITGRQIRATIVSANRQVWINALRDDLSELFEILTRQFALKSETDTEEETKTKSRVVFLIYRIELRLNPFEKSSQTLRDLVHQLQGLTYPSISADSIETFQALMASAVSTSQEILKTEWKRVKKGR